MKFSRIAILLLLAFGVVLACEDSNENLVKQRGANVVPAFEFTSAPVFTTNLAKSSVDFTVSLNDGDVADGGSIEVTYNGENATVVQDFSTFPADIHLEASELIEKMGLDASKIQTSDIFTIFVLTSKNGVKTRSVAAANIKIVCDFTPSLSIGKYNVVSESWEVQGNVEIVADPDDPYKVIVKGLETLDGVSGVDEVFFQINKAAFTIDNQTAFLMSNNLLEDWGADYGTYTYKISKGSYNSCDGSYTITFNIYSDAGAWGNYDFVFTRPSADDEATEDEGGDEEGGEGSEGDNNGQNEGGNEGNGK